MITGDNPITAEVIASEVGLNHTGLSMALGWNMPEEGINSGDNRKGDSLREHNDSDENIFDDQQFFKHLPPPLFIILYYFKF